MENILIGVFIFQSLHSFFQVAAFPKTPTESFIIHYLEDRRIIPVRIELNAVTQTEYVKSIAGETLYDFNLGKVAYKDLNSSQCFIMDIVEESIEKDRRRLKNLQNGVVRGFYLPTFIIQEEFNNTYNFTEYFGILLAEFCRGNTISLVVKQTHRRKRDTSEHKGQFTHHSYGHYGHQSNNYAHYGHETYVTGTADEHGRIQNQKVNHQQIRSQSSHVYPRPAHENGRQDFPRSDAGIVPRSDYTSGLQDSRTDSRTSANIPQNQYQTQHRMPSYQQTFRNDEKIPSIGGTGQFSLQSSHEEGYQLSLPLGLQAGNIYRGGVRSGGHYGVGGPQPQIRTTYQQYPDSRVPTGHLPFDQRQPLPLPPEAKVSYPSTLQRTDDSDIRKRPSSVLPDTSVSSSPIADDRRISPSAGKRTFDTQIPFTTGDQRQPDTHRDSQIRRQIEHKTVPSAQRTEDHPAVPHTPLHPSSGVPDMRIQGASYQPGISMPSIRMPTGTIQSPGHPALQHTPLHHSSGVPDMRIQGASYQPGISMPSIRMPSGTIQSPGQILTKTPTSDISHIQHVTGISRPGQIHDSYPSLIPHQQYVPRGSVPEQQYFQTPDVRHLAGFRANGDIQRPVPPTLTQIYPGHLGPSITDAGKQDITQVSLPGSSTIPRTPHVALPMSQETKRNGARYPDATHLQTTDKDVYPRSGSYPTISRAPVDTSISRFQPGETLLPAGTGLISQETTRDRISASRPGEAVQDSQYNLSIPSRGIPSETSMPTDRRVISGQTEPETSRIYGQDSASSQTQIQTGLEGTAAEASSAGHYKGLGSQTQVQGGYVGNGSFSAQAQSGFTGGVVQSQVQGGKQGGLSGSSAQVERVGSAQSQVQILQPSGSASSTAQGKFTGGTTQVQAQSSKTGGSAGAQAQSTGLSSSHVQVNIGGNDVNKDEQFQGTVSAAVHGSQSSGQSQTQLQGGYDSGRTYTATAQGGFDTALEFQGAVPPVGSLTNISSGILGGQQFIRKTGNQESQSKFRGDQRQTSGMPLSRDSTDIMQEGLRPPPPQTGDSRSFHPSSQTYDSQPSHPSSAQEPSRLLPSTIYRGAYPSYPTEVKDRGVIPVSPGDFSGYRRPDERVRVISSYPQVGASGVTEQQPRFGAQVPETRDRTLYEPGSPRQTYPTLPAHTLTGATDQHYLSRIPSSYPHLPDTYHPGATFDSRYIPSFSGLPQHPDSSQQAGMQARFSPPPSHFTDQPRFSVPSSQIIPSHTRSAEMPILTRPDGSQYIQPTYHDLPLPDQRKIQPEQPQVLSPSQQVQTEPRSQIPPQYPPVLVPRTQTQPEQTLISQLQPQIRPEQPQISPQKPHVTATTEKIPSEITEEGTVPGRQPGVSEPDKKDCCAALRDLKRRCCSGTSNRDRTSPCCRTSIDDIFDFSSDDDLDEDKEPCKVVKAICYIVYKPVGKARVCKPTATNGC